MTPPEPVARTSRGVGRAYLALSALNPAIFLVFYIALIPLFTAGYWGMASAHRDQDFYAPYARREPGALMDKAAVESDLTAALRRGLDATLPAHPDWTVNRERLNAYALTPPTEGEPEQGGVAGFTIYVFAQHQEARGPVGRGGPHELSLDLHRGIFSDPPVVCHSVATPPPMTSPLARDFDFDLVLTPPPPWRPARSICWPAEAEQRFQKLLAGWRGDPRGFRDLPGRLLYFSATTITTTGFGDIVPLSNLARILTGLEAVLGWMVAGLFLNSVAWRAGRSAGASV